MPLKDYLPFYLDPLERRSVTKRAQIVNSDTERAVAKLFRATALALGFTGLNGSTTRASFEVAPYDFNRIIAAADTDSYVRQGFNKYKELIWKEGWELVGENDEAVDYLYERIDYMEFAMRRSFQSLLDDIADQLVKFGNAFVMKSRGDLNPYFPGLLSPSGDKQPVVGYYVVPAETIEIKRDKNNRPLRYRQRIDNLVSGFKTRRMPSWSPEEVIHFVTDRKPGRAFGTPFAIAVLDDVIALRQMEEDIQNLVHKELFPLYKYKVGSEDHPAEPHEIDDAVAELASLRTDGGLVLPERHDVDVVGTDSNALDASEYLHHFMVRVCVGLGLSPHHLGILMDGGNRAVTDRLDIALYDKVKIYQRYLADTIRLHMFSELLLEGGFDPITHPRVRGESDRCEFRFREIDVDTQVKKENHILQKFASNVLTFPETRLALGEDPEAEEGLLQAAVMARLTPLQTKTADGQTKTEVPEKPDAAQPSTGGRPNPKNTKKGVGNKSKPSNQHGRRSSPNIRHSLDNDLLNDIIELLDDPTDKE